MGRGPTRITVEFDPGDPVQGRLVDAAGHGQAFYGWLELTRLLECARDSTRAPASAAGEPAAAEPDPSWGVR
jgi:hypothetical protein